jgi:hypothetical protein
MRAGAAGGVSFAMRIDSRMFASEVGEAKAWASSLTCKSRLPRIETSGTVSPLESPAASAPSLRIWGAAENCPGLGRMG